MLNTRFFNLNIGLKICIYLSVPQCLLCISTTTLNTPFHPNSIGFYQLFIVIPPEKVQDLASNHTTDPSSQITVFPNVYTSNRSALHSLPKHQK